MGRSATCSTDPGRRRSAAVRGIAIGLAGGIVRPDVEDTVADMVAARGVRQPPLVVNDAETIFASGTSASDGYVLVAGTGAIALAIRDRRAVARVDGHGWLLGDHGSAVWIGLNAVRSVLEALDGRSRATSLVDAVPAALGDLAGHGMCGRPARDRRDRARASAGGHRSAGPARR